MVPPRLKLGSGLSQLEANVDSGVYVPTQASVQCSQTTIVGLPYFSVSC